MKLLRVVLGNPHLTRLEGGWAAVALVKWVLAILVALYAYRLGGATAVGLAAVARMVPAAVAAPWLSVYVDHHSRSRILVVSLAVRLVIALGLWAAVSWDASLAMVLVLAALYGIADCLQKPTQAALLGIHAHDPTELAAANALWSILDNAAFLVGSLLVGALVALVGLPAGFVMCAVVLAVGLAIVAGLPTDDAPPPLPDVSPHDELWAGITAIRKSRPLRLLTGVLAADMFIQAVVDVLVVVIAISLLGAGEAWAGWLSAAWGVGGVLGGATAATLLARRHITLGLVLGLLLGGLPLAAVALWPEQASAAALFVLIGVGFGMVEVALLNLTQRLVPVDVLARVYGAQETVTIAAMAAGSLVASGLVVWLGEEGALVATGLMLPLTALVVLARRRVLDGGIRVSDDDFHLLRRIEPFATLPVATIETLAVRSSHVTVPAGDHVIQKGEPGDEFFVIESGEVEVSVNGVVRRREGPGDYFGEIALLRGTARTATVKALIPLHLLVLSRAEFLAAVEHPRTRHGLNRTAEERLLPD
ncbi:hypothetical protein N802_11355 [Knoellia sinensis KCTC 19936]|uniref:Cyclic nucleotide-binding domain-containing protein n=1 Tax=Knoellia sinensis KCTC 19936 TaxID=1385520 RepID=A0A0A0J0R0_9MICO|nr:MFS transporter [Knoellia sinensis]KGN29772.1 hypothetical protein N802_11355 [Knoellia sinensis KCTC 19936]